MKRDNRQQLLMIGGVVGIAVVAVAAVILLGALTDRGTERSDIDYAAIGSTVTEDGVYVLGNPDAPITIVEFADFLCGFCQDYKPTVDRVIEELVEPGLARFEFRAYPSLGSDAVYYAQLLECAGTLGGPETFWLAHEELFYHSSRGVTGTEAGRGMAETLNLSYADVLECTADAEQHEDNIGVGRQTQVQGTPAVRVRYGDNPMEPIVSFERAGIPFSELEQIVLAANGQQ
ncbi:MAG: DsbA family protein [Chloroflexota bacterium]